MHILCPHCHNPIEVVRLTPREEIAYPSCGSSFCLDTGATSAGRLLSRFTPLNTLGQGAFGTVFRSRGLDCHAARSEAPRVSGRGRLLLGAPSHGRR